MSPERLRDIIQDLFEIQEALHRYLGPETQGKLKHQMYGFAISLLRPLRRLMPRCDAEQPQRILSQPYHPNPRLYLFIFLPRLSSTLRAAGIPISILGSLLSWRRNRISISRGRVRRLPTLEMNWPRRL